MKLRELTLKENPGQAPAQGEPAPAQQQQKTAQGAKVAGAALGAKGGSGAQMAKGLDKVAQGGALPANLAKQIAPFAKNLEAILGDTAMRQKFMMLVKQAEKAGVAPQAAPESFVANETATAGATSAGSIASVANPVRANSKKKTKMQKPSDNGLDKDKIFGEKTIKR